VWTHIRDVADLERIRMGAMERFLADYEAGRREGRYVPHALPDRTPYADDAFDLGLSSHFLVLYANLGLDFTCNPCGKCCGSAAKSASFPCST
jgi:hypothetical protein